MFFRLDYSLTTIFHYVLFWLFIWFALAKFFHLWAKFKIRLLLHKLGASFFEYVVKVVPSKEINAFAFRYKNMFGKEKKVIGVTTGILKNVSEKEINFAVAHELAHHIKNHNIVKILTTTLMGGGELLIQFFSSLTPGWALVFLGLRVARSFIYQKQEYEADEVAYQLLRENGINPDGGLS